MLLFKKKFLPAIRTGEKTQTIRLWPCRRMRTGQRSYIPGAGYIDVLAVDEIDLAHLSDEDARPDGFTCANALRDELGSLYAQELAKGYAAYRVRFAISADQTKRESSRATRRKRAPARGSEGK